MGLGYKLFSELFCQIWLKLANEVNGEGDELIDTCITVLHKIISLGSQPKNNTPSPASCQSVKIHPQQENDLMIIRASLESPEEIWFYFQPGAALPLTEGQSQLGPI